MMSRQSAASVGAAFVVAIAVAAVAAPAASASSNASTSDALVNHARGQWWVDAAQLRARHASGLTGVGVNIALLDGPISPDVPDLVGQDVRPTASSCGEVNADQGPLSPSVPLSDVSFHSTSIAAVMVGSGRGNGPGGTGILGVAPGATLRTYAVFNTLDPAQNLMCDPEAMVGLIDRVVADGADIVEIPVTIQTPPPVLAAVNRGLARGVVFVVGAGNGGESTQPMSPGTEPGVLVVGSVGRTGQVSVFSPSSVAEDLATAQTLNASGSEIHVLAPGEDVLGGGLTRGAWTSDVLQSGTSGASAVVAGLLALMKQRWPGATGNQLLMSLLRNVTQPAGTPVWDPRRGFGAIDVAAVLSVDPRSYPDVQPLYGGLARVHDPAPPAPRIPTEIDAEGRLVVSPLGRTSSAGPTGSRSSGTSAPRGPVATTPTGSGLAAAPTRAAESDDVLARWVAAAAFVVAVVAAVTVLRRRPS
ncbi:MAG: S8 family serine peptidase [Lapillicoccus sp.]